ncbi:MAG: outer membrane protein assembly factor BamA [Verrucomicrobia bacterium]|nr:MAG: outer membrane protein assembly factor BamA [Verrucomicrobiota bacterium]PYL81541.1 MAG: outer membrane protein assembly factor BamA [Verrucomicrobiota bacterium]
MKEFSGWMRPPLSATWVAFICALLGAASARSQAPQASPGAPVIRSIEVEYTGPETVSKERILAQMRMKVGQPFSSAMVEQDVEALYKSGAVLNVRIFAEPEGDGVKVIVRVQTRSIVREIVIDGAERIKAKRLRKEIKLRLNQPIKEEQLEEARQKIIEVYQAHGFTDVNVQFRVDPIDERRGTARVVFTVNEGAKGAVSQIRFEGNLHFSDWRLRKEMKTKRKTIVSFIDKSGRLDEAQLQQDLDSIREWYQNHGFIDVEIKDVRRERNTKGTLTITIVIAEGPQYHVGKVTVSGEKVAKEESIRALLKMKEGSVYSPKQLHDDAKAVADAYGSGGYVDLVITPESTPAGPALVDVHYKIEEGERSFVNRVTIAGNTRTKDKVIRREVLVAPGDVFNTVRADLTKKRLENLGYFSKVETYPEETDVPGRKDLTILVQEKRTGSFSFGAGFSTIDQLVGFAELTQGNFDLFNWPTFTGGGQKFRLRVQYGTQRKDFLLNVTEPYFLDRRLSLSGQLFYTEADYLSVEYNQRNYGFTIDLRKPITSFIYVSLGYQLQDIDIFDVSSGASAFIKSQEGSFTESKIISSVVFDRRDNALLTRTGQRITLAPFVAGGFLGGNTQIYGWDLEGSQYFRLKWDTILLINGEIATVDNWGNGSGVPIFERLYLGGANNLRGFPYREVGPQDVTGEPIGGLSMARATVEWTFPIIEKARGAIFYDTGFVNSDAWSFGFKHIASDVGVGIRLNLPIGPLRLDYGYPLQRDGYNGGGHFNFSVGYQF